MSDVPETVFEFPCQFPIKVIGKDQDDFEAFVLEIVRRHVSNLEDGAVAARPSSGGKYISITVTFMAESREQLDNIYRELSSHKRVLMLL